MSNNDSFRPPGPCPLCGVAVPRKAQACGGCGASHDSGWNEEAAVSGLNLPDDSFDYEAFIEDEFGERRKPIPKRSRIWSAVAVLLLLALISGWVISLV